jgi:transcriptional regulator with XRE-family HTH domain
MTLGERLRRYRMDLGMSQVDLARVLGVDPWTLLNWEKDRARPRARHMAQIWELLGEAGQLAPRDVPAQVRFARLRLGLTQAQFAELLGVNPSTVLRWEQGRTMPSRGPIELSAGSSLSRPRMTGPT